MRSAYLALLLFSVFASLSALPAAQLGEQAGQPTLSVPLGGSATFNYSILNSGSAPINYTVVLPSLNTIPHNATPTVTVTPMNGTLAPHSQQVMQIKVSMPSSDKVNLTWQGIVQVVEAAPQSVSSGGASAVITAGVAKILTIHSVAPKGIPVIYLLILAVVAVVAVIGILSYLLFAARKKTQARTAAAIAADAKAIKGLVRGRPPAKGARKKRGYARRKARTKRRRAPGARHHTARTARKRRR